MKDTLSGAFPLVIDVPITIHAVSMIKFDKIIFLPDEPTHQEAFLFTSKDLSLLIVKHLLYKLSALSFWEHSLRRFHLGDEG